MKKNNIMDIKKSLNNIITSINSTETNLEFNKLFENYNLGYFYANPKIHHNKLDPPYTNNFADEYSYIRSAKI